MNKLHKHVAETILRLAHEQRAALWQCADNKTPDDGTLDYYANMDPIYCLSLGEPILEEGEELRSRALFDFDAENAVICLKGNDQTPLCTLYDALNGVALNSTSLMRERGKELHKHSRKPLALDRSFFPVSAIQVDLPPGGLSSLLAYLNQQASAQRLHSAPVQKNSTQASVINYLQKYGSCHDNASSSNDLNGSPLQCGTEVLRKQPCLESGSPHLKLQSDARIAPETGNSPVLIRSFSILCPPHLLLATRFVRAYLRGKYVDLANPKRLSLCLSELSNSFLVPLCLATLESIRVNCAFNIISQNPGDKSNFSVNVNEGRILESLLALHSGLVLLLDTLSIEANGLRRSVNLHLREKIDECDLAEALHLMESGKKSLTHPLNCVVNTVFSHIVGYLRLQLINHKESNREKPSWHTSPHGPSRNLQTVSENDLCMLKSSECDVNAVAWAAGLNIPIGDQYGDLSQEKKANKLSLKKDKENGLKREKEYKKKVQSAISNVGETLPALSRTSLSSALAQSLGEGAAILPPLLPLYPLTCEVMSGYVLNRSGDVLAAAKNSLRVVEYLPGSESRRSSIALKTALEAIETPIEAIVGSDPSLAILRKLVTTAKSQLWGPWIHLRRVIHSSLSPKFHSLVTNVVEPLFKTLTTTLSSINPQTAFAIIACLPALVGDAAFFSNTSSLPMYSLPISPLAAVGARADIALCSALLSQHPLTSVMVARLPAYVEALTNDIPVAPPEIHSIFDTSKSSATRNRSITLKWECELLDETLMLVIKCYRACFGGDSFMSRKYETESEIRSLISTHSFALVFARKGSKASAASPLANFLFSSVAKCLHLEFRSKLLSLLLGTAQLSVLGTVARWSVAIKCGLLMQSNNQSGLKNADERSGVLTELAGWRRACQDNRSLEARIQATGANTLEEDESMPMNEELEDEDDEARSIKYGVKSTIGVVKDEVYEKSGAQTESDSNSIELVEESGCAAWMRRRKKPKELKSPVEKNPKREESFLSRAKPTGNKVEPERVEGKDGITDKLATFSEPTNVAKPLDMIEKVDCEHNPDKNGYGKNIDDTPLNMTESNADDESRALTRSSHSFAQAGRSRAEVSNHATKCERLAAWIGIMSSSDFGNLDIKASDACDAIVKTFKALLLEASLKQAEPGNDYYLFVHAADLSPIRIYSVLMRTLGIPDEDILLLCDVNWKQFTLPTPRRAVGAALFASTHVAQLWTEIASTLRETALAHRSLTTRFLSNFTEAMQRIDAGSSESNKERLAATLKSSGGSQGDLIVAHAAAALLPVDPRLTWVFAARLGRRLQKLKLHEEQATIALLRTQTLHNQTSSRKQLGSAESDSERLEFLSNSSRYREEVRTKMLSLREKLSALSTRWLLDLDRLFRSWRDASDPNVEDESRGEDMSLNILVSPKSSGNASELLGTTTNLPGGMSSLQNEELKSSDHHKLEIDMLMLQAERGKVPKDVISYLMPKSKRLLFRLGKTAARSCVSDLLLIERLETVFNPIFAEGLCFVKPDNAGRDASEVRITLLSLVCLAALNNSNDL